MAIVQHVSFSTFVDAFRARGREGQFSYQGLKALFEHLEDLSEFIGEDIELDVVGICCDYSEWDESSLAIELGMDPIAAKDTEDARSYIDNTDVSVIYTAVDTYIIHVSEL